MNRIRKLRIEKNITQEKLAEFLNVSGRAIGYYETGKREPDFETLKKLADYFDVTTDYLLGMDKNDKRLLPVLGTVKAGYNYLAEENVIDYIDPSMNLSDPENYFGLKVKGTSMSPLFDEGDYVIVHKMDGEFNNNSICIVLVNGDEATVKKVVKTDEGIELHAFNPYYPVKKFTYKEIEELPVKIIGTVVRQIRDWK